MAQSVIHVPLVVRAPSMPRGEVDDVVTVRNLTRFIEMAAQGGRPGVDEIVRPDDFGVVAERYPSWYSVDILGEDYSRAWVSMIEQDAKVVGPTSFGLRTFNVGPRSFADKEVLPGSQAARDLAARIDEYWERHRDRREGSVNTPMSDAERRRLRTLGYIR